MVIGREDRGEGFIWERIKPTSALVAIVSVLFALITGGLAALATTALGQSVWPFRIVAVITAGYLWKKRFATEAAGSGLYISALLLILTPILSSIPTVLGTPSDPKAPMLIVSILGFVTWGLLFLLAAIWVGALGYYFKGRAAISEADAGRYPN